MRVLVTRRTAHVFETERQNLIGPASQPYFVAIRAGDRQVCPRQGEEGLLVHHYSEGRLMEILDGMAVLALILIRRGGKLAVVGIFVAIRAGCELNFVNRILARR